MELQNGRPENVKSTLLFKVICYTIEANRNAECSFLFHIVDVCSYMQTKSPMSLESNIICK